MCNIRKPVAALGICILIVCLSGCEDYKERYYVPPVNADVSLYDALSIDGRFSEFLWLISENNMDSVFEKNEPLTLFIPENSAFEGLELESIDVSRILAYHIANFLINIHEVKDYRKVQTYFGKFSTLINESGQMYYDQVPVSEEGGYYKNGTFYVLEEVSFPKPNLYEYMQDVCPPIAEYVDYNDSVGFDPLISEPIGFDSLGNTVYDSVFLITNLFERDYYPVTEEGREDMATMILFSQEQYEAALDIMALNLGGDYQTGEDIPLDWQFEVLMPYFMDIGVFQGILGMEDFAFRRILNIKGDSVVVDPANIDPESRTLCSNGVAYNYYDFTIPEEIYQSRVRFEGEDLIELFGEGTYAWKEEVVTSDPGKAPALKSSSIASGEAYLSVSLSRAQTADYSIEFKLPRVFPKNYKFYWRAYYRPSGKVSFYVNGEKIGTFDNYNFRYPVDGVNPVGSFNQKGFPVSITEYGDVHVKMVYEHYGDNTSSNGICLDYIELIAEE